MARSVAVAVCALGALSAAAAGGAAGATEAQTSPQTSPQTSTQTSTPGVTSLVRLAFDGLRAGDDPAQARNRGKLAVRTSLASAASGRILVEPGPDGQVLRFPSLSPTTQAQRAMLVVTAAPATGRLSLNPRERDFSFGADFALDALSEQPALDNGNNLVQRGLSSDPAQYKVQVDHGHASCRVAGTSGSVLVESTSTVEPGTWYRVKCSRHSGDLVLKLTRLRDGRTERVTASGATGGVALSDATPLSVGGKVTSQGKAIERNADQFNGAVDNVFLRVADGG